MSLETSIIPDIEKIANMKKDTGVFKIPTCIANTYDTDGNVKPCSCGFCDGKQKVIQKTQMAWNMKQITEI